MFKDIFQDTNHISFFTVLLADIALISIDVCIYKCIQISTYKINITD